MSKARSVSRSFGGRRWGRTTVSGAPDEQRKNAVTVRDRTDNSVQPPRFFKVIILNDDYTPANWVTTLLMRVFRKDPNEAFLLTQQIHNSGFAVIGIYTHEVAETKCFVVEQSANAAGHPLRATMEPDT